MRLVLAGRLSKKVKGQTGLDTQDEDARLWAVSRGHSIVFAAADHISGRMPAFDRPKLGPWLNDPGRMALYDGVLFSKMDRATRTRGWDVRQWAEQHDKKLIVVMPELEWPPKPDDLATPMIWDDMVNIAVAEWENTSQRYLRMQKALREQAFFVGKRPYPYRIVPVEGTEHKTLEPDPVTGTVAKRMAALYLDGWSLREIAEWLTENSYEAPQPPKDTEGKGWTAQAIRRILRNPAVTGRIQVKGRTYLRVKPIISLDEYNRIGSLMEGRVHRGIRKETAFLTSILHCQDGKPMYRIQGRKIPSVPDGFYYYCRECPKGKRLLLPLATVDQAVNDSVMAYANLPHIVTKVTPGEDWADEIEEVRQEIRELDPEADDYDTQLAKLRAELARLRSLPSKPAKVEQNPDGKTVGQWWESLDTAAKRKFLLDSGTKIYADRDPDGLVSVVIGPNPHTFEGELFALMDAVDDPR
jgi:site-specific DNA recombinase